MVRERSRVQVSTRASESDKLEAWLMGPLKPGEMNQKKIISASVISHTKTAQAFSKIIPFVVGAIGKLEASKYQTQENSTNGKNIKREITLGCHEKPKTN